MTEPAAAAPTVVVHVFGSLARGGAELRTLEVVDELPRESIRSVFVCLSGRRGELAERAEASGGLVVPLALGPGFPMRFVRLLREQRADVVHSHVATFSGFVLSLAALAGVGRRISHFRSDGDEHGTALPRRVQRRVMKRLLSFSATRIVGVSPGALTHGWRRGWQADPRCSVIPNGLRVTDPGPEPGRRGRTRADEAIPPHARTVIFVGKSTPAKNLLRALVLLTALCEADPDACALLVGPFSDEDATAIAEVSARSRLRGRIRLLGVRTDVRALLQAADVLLLTSVREGLPGVVLEALAEGTPVVSSDLPGSRWIAEQTAGVELVGLEEPDSSWLRAMRHALGRADGAHRHEIAAAFLRSPFRLEETVAALSVLWVPSTSAPRPTIASVRET